MTQSLAPCASTRWPIGSSPPSVKTSWTLSTGRPLNPRKGKETASASSHTSSWPSSMSVSFSIPGTSAKSVVSRPNRHISSLRGKCNNDVIIGVFYCVTDDWGDSSSYRLVCLRGSESSNNAVVPECLLIFKWLPMEGPEKPFGRECECYRGGWQSVVVTAGCS